MSDDRTTRALLISMLNQDQLARLHIKEISLNYCLPPYNACALFKMGSIKEFYGVPDDSKKISQWSQDCQSIMNSTLGHDFFPSRPMEVHEFDFVVHMNRNKLDFSYKYQKKSQYEDKIIEGLKNPKEFQVWNPST